ncbi:MAG TPA: carbon-nitrogen hydrolase family protein [Thermoguttaceae bacterium]|nr:carbon-nitrogen hydrolase family protein [Thermoguttaceae bacterium]
MKTILLGILLGALALAAHAEETKTTSKRLRIGVVQMAVGPTVEVNRDRIVSGVAQAASRGVRVAVFPEGVLRGKGGDDQAAVDEAVAAIRGAARESNIYVLFGGYTYLPRLKKAANWMLALGPDGRDVFRYEKLYDNHRAAMPGVFSIDGIPCNAMICADRWLRGVQEIPIQQGAQISFELSCNFASEWVAPFGWYWYVPRAMRNNVWVVFANTGNKVSGVPDDPAAPRELRHGHSAIIAPDGAIAAAAKGDAETIVVADLDLGQATRAEALARSTSPVLGPFWTAGVKLHRGQAFEAPPLAPLKSAETDITLAAAQGTGDFSDLEPMIRQASEEHADIVVFPERAIAERALQRLQTAAREHQITLVVGMEHQRDGGRYNSAFVVGPDGSLLTRYDQLSATSPYEPGDDPSAMWFRVEGVPAVVTIGRDALWSELPELAGVVGTQIHIHLDHDTADDQDASLRRLQVWSNMASFHTFTATVNVTGSAIWDDLRDAEERRVEVRGLPRPDTGPVEVYSPFSANLVVRAGDAPQLITATRHIGPLNRYHPSRTSNFNPQMDAWYRLGAAIIGPSPEQPRDNCRSTQ